jgi:hypothetical protein
MGQAEFLEDTYVRRGEVRPTSPSSSTSPCVDRHSLHQVRHPDLPTRVCNVAATNPPVMAAATIPAVSPNATPATEPTNGAAWSPAATPALTPASKPMIPDTVMITNVRVDKSEP